MTFFSTPLYKIDFSTTLNLPYANKTTTSKLHHLNFLDHCVMHWQSIGIINSYSCNNNILCNKYRSQTIFFKKYFCMTLVFYKKSRRSRSISSICSRWCYLCLVPTPIMRNECIVCLVPRRWRDEKLFKFRWFIFASLRKI